MYQFILISALLSLAVSVHASTNSLLSELDAVLAQRGKYIEKKENRILLLKQQIKEESDNAVLLKLYEKIYQEYYVYKFDSAMIYVDKGYHIAMQNHNQRYVNLFQFHRSELLAMSGLYSEAQTILDSVDSATVCQQDLFKYNLSYFTLYSYKTSFSNDSTYAPVYRSIANQYLIKAINYLSPQDPLYSYYIGEKYVYLEKDDLKARESYLKMLQPQRPAGRETAMSCFALSGNYLASGDSAKHIEYLIKSSIYDIQCATMENSALQNLAVRLFQEGDIERAERYINISMEDAKFYNNRLRILEISRIMPQIMTTYQNKIEQQNKDLRYSVIFISLLVLGLILTTYYIYLQNRKLTARRRELADNNQQLQALNQQLVESNQQQTDLNNQLHVLNKKLVDTNKRRESLATIYIDLCAKYIDKLSKYQTLVKRKIKANQAQELLQTISSTRMSEEDAATFLNRFDKAFLELYPTFVEEFNALLTKEGRIQQKSPMTLTTELRTFALIRLGVKNTTDIAGLLFLSTQTIYNCRSLTRNKAINQETFDEDVKRLCTVI